MEKSGSNTQEDSQPWIPAGFLLAISCLLSAFSLQFICEQSRLGTAFFSPASWQWGVVNLFGGEFIQTPDGQTILLASFFHCLIAIGLLQAGIILLAGWKLKFQSEPLAHFVSKIAKWWLLLGSWGVLWLIALISQWELIEAILQSTLVFWVSVTIAGVLYELANLFLLNTHSATAPALELPIESQSSWKGHLPVLIAISVFTICFTAMNFGLWFNLRIPHGDSAMYEEHLWNFTHGKGFRSYLDQGLFWGEHIQFVHLFLVPLHWLWPSHLLLEFCESFALAIGALPVYWMTLRSSQSKKAATLLSMAYLLYFPLQFLDISIDLKTFRPISFGVPIVLFALDQLERKRFATASALLVFSLSCKEDFAIVIFSIGLALLVRAGWIWFKHRKPANQDQQYTSLKNEVRYGLAYFLLGPAYLLFALNLIRSFRSGVEVHYAGYFSKFGNSTSEIMLTMITNPGLLIGELVTINTLVYALALFVPLGFAPFRGGWRIISCLPMFVLLCLNELSQSPMHHFHAPLIPLIFWSVAAGFPTNRLFTKSSPDEEANQLRAQQRGCWIVCSALATSIWFTLTPLGIPFWDTGSNWNGAKLYIPDERAKMFEEIKEQIPRSARVASTDFVHPRFTHHLRSYDYSNYVRKVGAEDSDYIVIDTRHPYSTITTPEEVQEYRESPDQWKLLPDRTNGYFLIFERQK